MQFSDPFLFAVKEHAVAAVAGIASALSPPGLGLFEEIL
jgi:hypothetical protein